MYKATVTLRHKKKGRIITVDQDEWATDLGAHKFRRYERVGETHNNDASVAIEVNTPEPVIEETVVPVVEETVEATTEVEVEEEEKPSASTRRSSSRSSKTSKKS